MKKLVLVAVMVLALPAMAWSAPCFVNSGNYKATINSPAVPDMNGKTATATVKTEGDNCVAEVTFYDGAKEKWVFNDKSLTQTELADGRSYKALAKTPLNNNTQSYNVFCANPNSPTCDAGIDSRGVWTLKSTNDGFSYSYTGVAMKDAGKKEIQPSKRFEFTFKKAN